ncbi:MAG TPA: RING finger protein [Planctomycetota bacterium]|nr:RING finger protein [Planctomycetota bacterium]
MSAPEPAALPKEFEAGTSTAGKLCSICQTGVIAGERIVYCPACNLPFHTECWKENGGCSAYGCECTPKTTKHAEGLPVTNAWAGEKPCPACGKTIKGQALKCRFCGASFETRDVVSKEEYLTREYEGKEYNAARNKVVGLFLLSAAACLSPLALVLNGVLIYQKEFMGIDYRRLPSTLKALVWCSVGISGFLLLLMGLMILFD